MWTWRLSMKAGMECECPSGGPRDDWSELSDMSLRMAMSKARHAQAPDRAGLAEDAAQNFLMGVVRTGADPAQLLKAPVAVWVLVSRRVADLLRAGKRRANRELMLGQRKLSLASTGADASGEEAVALRDLADWARAKARSGVLAPVEAEVFEARVAGQRNIDIARARGISQAAANAAFARASRKLATELAQYGL